MKARSATWFDGLLILGSVLLFGLLAGPALIMFRRIPLNYNEGWNAYFAVRAMGGAGPLYPPASSLVFDNYPPLSFYLVGGFGRFVVGDMIVAGRMVALAGLLAAGLLLGRIVGRAAGLRAGLATALLVVLYAATFFRDYVAMDDPQWLGQALMLAGLGVLLRAPQRIATVDVVLAALLMVAGGLVKENLVALPLAVTVWLFAQERRRVASVWLGVAAAGLAAGIALTVAAYGPRALLDVFAHPRLYQAAGVMKSAGRMLPLLPMALVAAPSLIRDRRQGVAGLAVLLLPIAVVTGLVQSAGEGVADNALFESLIATCFAFGLACSDPQMPNVRAALAAAAILPILLVMPRRLPHAWRDLVHPSAREAAFRPVIQQIAASHGPALCETLALCYWAGKPFTLDLFNLTQRVLIGGPDPTLAALVGARAFGIVEYDPGSPIHTQAIDQAGVDPVMDAVRLDYRPIGRGPKRILLLGPRPPP